MVNTEDFIERLYQAEFTHLCVVPCSFAKNLINACINNSDRIAYVPCASEAVACSVAAGLRMSGKRPIVIVQSSGVTNMGSCITSLLKPYDVRFPIITSWRTYKEGDSEIQHKHLAKWLRELISAYGYESEALIADNSKVTDQLFSALTENKILLLSKGFFSEVQLASKHRLDLSSYPPRSKYLQHLNKVYANSETVFVGTTGNLAREMYSLMPETKNFYMAGNMGGALSIGLGSYLGGNDTVVCGGDAEFVMHMGGMTTAARYSKEDQGSLLYLVFDNESNKSTGGQYTYQRHVYYRKIAQGSGFHVCEEIVEDVDRFKECLLNVSGHGLCMMHIKCAYDTEMPRPPMNTVKQSVQAFSN